MMKIRAYARGGGSCAASGAREVRKLIRSLVDQLCEEHFSRPDFEHGWFSVTSEDDWTIAVYLEGEVNLWQGEEERLMRYLFNVPPDDLVELIFDLARCDLPKVLSRPWALKRNQPFYLYASRPETPDLFRAVACGDVEWVKAEIAVGSDVNVRDEHFGTPLHHAALGGWIEVCRVLLDAGADPTVVIDGETPAGYARGSDEYLHDKAKVAELVALLEEAAKRKG